MTRLTSAILSNALIRRVSDEGGMAAVLAKGDPTSGTILILARKKGEITGLYERLLTPAGTYAWQNTGPQDMVGEEPFDFYIQRRRSRDPDLWVVELDIPNAERFIVEMTSEG